MDYQEQFYRHLIKNLALDLHALAVAASHVYRAWERGESLDEPMDALREVLADIDVDDDCDDEEEAEGE
ncbi:hypothetical protein [Alicyclobacillus acidocaldarius]|uniref:hypothetical protein n=1 Tax=Alicyclobacillus acidocaldarius TaxID=405212 RepID=UPI00030D5CB3|nr:hypothetical protein [Alicyclobacillus acidocaldarius]